MDYQDIDSSYVALTFEEANILMRNCWQQDHAGILARLDNVLNHTTDPDLRREIENLLRKLQNMTPEEFNILAKDVAKDAILFPPNYALPHLS